MSNLIINLRGGTGNQLFRFAAAFSLAFIYKKNCQFCIDEISKDKYKRKLDIYPILKNLGVDKNETGLKTKKNIIFLDEYDIDHPIYFSQSSPLADFKKDILLDGYFTNYRIHNKYVIEKIKASLKELQIEAKFKKLEFISIHIRELHGTGNSRKIKKKIDNLGINYYSKALNQIIKDPIYSGIKNAVVFCDLWQNPEDSKLLPQIIKLLNKYGIRYINGDKEIKSPLDIINIFSYSKCSIISNSTLSWWGAYLSNGKIFSPVMNLWEPGLQIPDHWEQIYSEEINPLTHHNKLIFQLSIKSERDTNFLIYSFQRLLVIRLFRKISKKISETFKFIKFTKYLNYLGIKRENSNSTYF